MKNYLRFAAMIITSTTFMYFLMYLNIYELNHFAFGETRLYMALIMGSAMAVIMLTYMLKMYTNKRINMGIYAFSIVLFAVSLFLVRSQMTIDDVSYMKSMIPHHSIAILTSERANIRDPRVRALANEIIETQIEEIAEMERLIRELENDR